MAITQSVCNSFKSEVLKGLHNFSASGGDVFKIALYTSNASLNSATTAYTTTGEVSDSGTNYTAGGKVLTNIEPSMSSDVGFTDFENVSWASASFTARGALIYNSTNANRAVVVLDFGLDRVVSAATFTVTFPNADPQNAIVRFK
jgi:hypothetical protein